MDEAEGSPLTNEYRWNIERYSDVYLSGWIGKMSEPLSQIMIALKSEGEFKNIVPANIERPDVEEAYGFLKSGFEISIRGSQLRSVSIFAKGVEHDTQWTFLEKIELGNGFMGYVEGIAGDRIQGWAVIPYINSDLLEVELLYKGRIVSSSDVSISRQDVQNVHGGDGKSGFELRAPWGALNDRNRCLIRVRAGGEVVHQLNLPDVQRLNPPFNKNFVRDNRLRKWTSI